MKLIERFTAAGLALAFLLMIAAPVFAASLTYTWTTPTTREDGSPLPAAEIAGFRIEYGSCSGTAFGTKAGDAIVTGNVTTGTVTGLAPATIYCARAYTRDTAGRESSIPTRVQQKTTPDLTPPSAPGNFTVTVATIAGTNLSPVYRFDERGGPLERAAGLIEAGAMCTGPVLFQRDGHRYRRVNARDVDVWFGGRNGRLAAACG